MISIIHIALELFTEMWTVIITFNDLFLDIPL